jgi:hypothetical protein
MITCTRKHLEARCRQRGYAIEDARPCIVSEEGDTITVDETHPAYPKAPEKPSLAQRAVNFATAAASHVAAGAPAASSEEVSRRFAICQTCEFYDGKACTKCGCPVVREKQYISKLSWADQSCPVGKWGPEPR